MHDADPPGANRGHPSINEETIEERHGLGERRLRWTTDRESGGRFRFWREDRAAAPARRGQRPGRRLRRREMWRHKEDLGHRPNHQARRQAPSCQADQRGHGSI